MHALSKEWLLQNLPVHFEITIYSDYNIFGWEMCICLNVWTQAIVVTANSTKQIDKQNKKDASS